VTASLCLHGKSTPVSSIAPHSATVFNPYRHPKRILSLSLSLSLSLIPQSEARCLCDFFLHLFTILEVFQRDI